MIAAYIRLARPKDWLKNVFVFLPVPFALASGAQLDPVPFVLGLLGFMLTTSAVYSFNDARDAERDRLHESKRSRPVAAGLVSESGAYVYSALLVSAGLGLAWACGRPAAIPIFAAYIGLQLAYSLGAKHITLVDVFLLSSGFVIRVLLGCTLLQVPASNWLLLCASTLALFLSLAKRRGDLVKGLDDNHRPSLAGYNTAFLEQAMGICAGMTIVAYALYTLESEVLKPGREFAALPFVVFGVLDYLRLAHVRGKGGSPVDVLLSSPALLVAGVGWLAAVVWSLSLP
ncbi:MAG: decaprenyl-phosphate phosphoribosyltransferase [Myxococcales bacterium]|nr:decaprenyl-phosphate phosphoribosyltransferase [Myxococcales bacterium]